MAALEFTISTTNDYKTFNSDPNNKKVVIDEKIKELNVSETQEKAGFRQFCEGLALNSTLLSLDVSRINMPLEHCVYLVQALKQNKTLTNLSLYGNMLGVAGMRYIKELLEVNSTLEELNLKLNSLGDEGCELICQGLTPNRSLKRLTLVNNNLTSKALIHIGTLLVNNTTLNDLDLSRNKLTDPSGFERSFNRALQINKTLTGLGLSYTNVTLSMLKEGLLENCSLQLLNISGNYTLSTDLDGIDEILTENTSLRYLLLNSIDIKPIGFEKLAEGLRSNSTLTTIFAEIYHVHDRCISHIIDSLETNMSLTNVSIKRAVVGRFSEEIPEINDKLLAMRKSRIEDTRVNMLTIIRSIETFQQLPLEIWHLIFSFLQYSGTRVDFGEEFKHKLRDIKLSRFIKEGMQKSTQAFVDKLFDALTAQ